MVGRSHLPLPRVSKGTLLPKHLLCSHPFKALTKPQANTVGSNKVQQSDQVWIIELKPELRIYGINPEEFAKIFRIIMKIVMLTRRYASHRCYSILILTKLIL